MLKVAKDYQNSVEYPCIIIGVFGYDAEVGRFINMDDISILDETKHQINGLNLYMYCGNNPVMNYDPDGRLFTSFLLGLAIASVTMAIVNTGVRLVGDVINWATTGHWNSSWEHYVGAFVGGLVGGAVFYLTGGVGFNWAFGTMGFTQSLTTDLLTNATGRTQWSGLEVLGRGAFWGITGFATGAIFSGVALQGVTRGANNFLAVFKSGLTKLRNGTVARMSMRVIAKGIAALAVYRSLGALIGGGLSATWDWFSHLVIGGDRVGFRVR